MDLLLEKQLEQQLIFADCEHRLELSKQKVLTLFRRVLEETYREPEEIDDIVGNLDKAFGELMKGVESYGRCQENWDNQIEKFRKLL